jgi:hypothetical protein
LPAEGAGMTQYDEKSETLRVRLSGDVSAEKYEQLAAEINGMSPEMKVRLLINIVDVYKSAPLKGDSNDSSSGRIRMVDGHRAAIVDRYPVMRMCGRNLLALFTGDYEVRFFTKEAQALAWLKGTNNDS